jgi:hypothetical protein
MSRLLASFGAIEAFGHGAQLPSEALGFEINASAVQRNTGAIGGRIPDNPCAMIESTLCQTNCEMMAVEVDGTISPQIHGKQGIVG